MRISILLVLSLAFGLAFLAACTKPDATALRDGLEAEHQGNYDQAITTYQKILKDYPNGTYAPEAQFHLASLEQGYKKDNLKAASLYESIYKKYPSSEFAHRGLFLAGFIYNNDLGNTARAKEVYTAYLKNYPDSSFAADAKLELNTLGKSPDEVLQAMRDTLKPPKPMPESDDDE